MLRNLLPCLVLISTFAATIAHAHDEKANSDGATPVQFAPPPGVPPEEWGDSGEAELDPTAVDHAPPADIREAHERVERHKKKGHHESKFCSQTFASVKNYLLEHGLTDRRLEGKCAWQATTTLPKAGFVRTAHTIGTAEIDEVCVFGGSNFGCDGRPVGTIMVRTKNGFYDGCPHKPEEEAAKRPFMGCYVKPKTKTAQKK